MTDNTFDKFVRDKLSDHQSPVPPGLWDKIQEKKDKDRKFGFLPRTALWTGIIVLLTGAAITYRLLDDQPATFTRQGQTTAAAGDGQGVKVTPPNETQKDISIVPENDQENSATGVTMKNVTSDKPDDEPTLTADKHDDPVTSAGSSQQYDGRTNNDRSSYQASVNHKKTIANNMRSSGSKKTGNDIRVRKSSGETSTHSSPTSAIINDRVKVFDQPEASADSWKRFSEKGRSAVTGKSMFFQPDYSAKNQQLGKLSIIGIDCPPNGRMRRNDFYLEVFGSPDMPMKSVKANNNSTYLSKKDSTETQQLSYSAGFRLSKAIGENLLVKTGLQYSQINEKFVLRTENERRITTVITIRTIISANGTDSTVRDTTRLEQIGYSVQRTYNKYRSLDVPVLLSYEFGGDQLKFAVNAGIIFNLHSWYAGNTLNDSLAVVSLSSKSNGLYKTNIGMGVYAGFSIIKPVSNKLDVFAEPYFRYNLSNMSRSSSYSQRFNAAGITLGIRYRLSRQRGTGK